MHRLTATAEDLRYAYRLFLGREPDPEGFEHNLKHVLAGRLTPGDIARIFARSEESRLTQSENTRFRTVQLHGVKVFPWEGDSLIGDALAKSGKYEPNVLPRFLERLRPGDVVLDVGANIGTYALTAAAKVGPSGKVIAVEPVARNVRSICMGVLSNAFTNVSLLQCAASGSNSVIGVIRGDNSSNGIVDAHVGESAIAEFVPTLRLDEVLGYLDRLDVLKIDIEGHEPIAWPGLAGLVQRHKPVIFSEFNPPAILNHSRVAPEEYLQQLFAVAAGEVLVIHGDDKPVACTSPAEIMERYRRANRGIKNLNEGRNHFDLIVHTAKS